LSYPIVLSELSWTCPSCPVPAVHHHLSWPSSHVPAALAWLSNLTVLS
jgi:hypothetical protein